MPRMQQKIIFDGTELPWYLSDPETTTGGISCNALHFAIAPSSQKKDLGWVAMRLKL